MIFRLPLFKDIPIRFGGLSFTKNKNMIEGGYILPSVLLISFLIITLLFGILSVIWFNHTFDIKRINKKELDLACYSAIQKHLILFAKDSSGGNYYTKIDSIDVLVNYHIKGLFYSVSAKSTYSRDSSKVHYYWPETQQMSSRMLWYFAVQILHL